MINAIIILNYCDKDNTQSLVNDILNYDCIQDIVIVDNASPDNSYDFLLKCYENHPHIHVINTKYNGGYAYGNNIGCRYAIEVLKADYLTIANPDITFESSTLEGMLDCARNHEDSGCVTAKLSSDKKMLTTVWKQPTFFDCVMEAAVVMGRIYRKKIHYEMIGKEQQADVVSGAFFVINAESYLNCGGFDEETFLYYEENILAKRLAKIQKKNYVVTDVEFQHKISASIDKNITDIRTKFKMAQAGRRIYLGKYLGCCKALIVATDIVSLIGRNVYCLISKIWD